SETERWAEPLKRGFPRILQQDLERRLGPDSVVAFPWPVNRAPARTVTIEVQHFERRSDGKVELSVRWTLRGREGRVLAAKDESILEPLVEPSAEGGVGALSRTLFLLGSRITAALR